MICAKARVNNGFNGIKIYIIKGTIAGFRSIGVDETLIMRAESDSEEEEKNESDDRKLPFDIRYCYFHWGKMRSKKKTENH